MHELMTTAIEATAGYLLGRYKDKRNISLLSSFIVAIIFFVGYLIIMIYDFFMDKREILISDIGTLFAFSIGVFLTMYILIEVCKKCDRKKFK